MPESQQRPRDLSFCRTLYLGAVLGATWAAFFPDAALSNPLGKALLAWALVFSYIAPGIFLVAALRPHHSAAVTTLTGFGGAWLAASVLDALCKAVLPAEISNLTFVLAWGGIGVGALLLLQRRQSSTAHTHALGTLILGCSVLTVATALLLTGQIFEADLNPDGYEFFMGTRSLHHEMLPSWPDLPGGMPIGIGGLSSAMAARPFDAFFLLVDATSPAGTRVSGLLGAFCLLAVVQAFRRDSEGLSFRSLVGPGLGILAISMTIATCSGYDPLSCDLASPFAIDLVALAALMAFVAGLQQGSWPLILAFGLLATLARPTPLVTIGILGFACWMTKALERRECLRRFAAGLVVCLGAVWLQRLTGEPEDSPSIVSRLRFLTFADVSRLRFLLLPSGLIAALPLLLPMKLDRWGRALLITCWSVFAFFAMQSFFSLHHFLLPMFLPVLIFWRSEFAKNRSLGAAAMLGSLTVVAALALQTPPTPTQIQKLSDRVAFGLSTTSRTQDALDRAASVLQVNTSTTEETTDAYRHALARIVLLNAPTTPTDNTDFYIVGADDAPPEGWVIVQQGSDHRRLERSHRPIRDLKVHGVPFAHPLLAIPLEVQLRHIGEGRGNFDVDLQDFFPWR